jgi:hypothetical protein
VESNETDADRVAVKTVFDAAHDALNRMKRAYDRGTGCHLTAEMISALSVTVVGSLWNDPDPRMQDFDR